MAARLTAYLVVAIVGATLIAGLIVGAQRDDSNGPVDLIIQNGAVYTAGGDGAMAEAVAVRGNQILRVGTNREIARLRRPQTIVVDARGGAVLPGFNDAHLRLIEGGLALGAVDLTGSQSSQELLERIGRWASAHPGRPWVVGRGWSPAQFRNGLPSRQLLDSVVPDRPALLVGADDRSVWVNSAALAAADVTAGTPDPDGGLIVRDPRTGDAAGVLQGAARDLVARLVPPPPVDEQEDALRAAMAEANALGITSVQSTGDSTEALALYDRLRHAGDLTLRIYAALPVAQPLTDADLERLDAIRDEHPNDALFKTGALSIHVDGPVEGRAAAMLEPYGAVPAEAAAGDTRFTPDDLNRTVRLADAAGWQILVHAHGDRAVRMALTAYAHAARSNPPPRRGRRHRIEGLSIVDPADLPRFEPLGVVASMQPSRSAPRGETHPWLARHLGEVRATRAYRFRSLSESARLVFGSAWPAEELDPLLGLQAATGGGGAPRMAEARSAPQDLPVKAAVEAYTSAAAWASFDDQRKGSVAPGMLADIVVLSENIFEPGGLEAASVVTTIFDGKIVYSRVPREETAPLTTAPQ